MFGAWKGLHQFRDPLFGFVDGQQVRRRAAGIEVLAMLATHPRRSVRCSGSCEEALLNEIGNLCRFVDVQNRQ